MHGHYPILTRYYPTLGVRDFLVSLICVTDTIRYPWLYRIGVKQRLYVAMGHLNLQFMTFGHKNAPAHF